MSKTKAQKSGSWTPQIQKKAPSLAPPPIVVQRDPVSGETETPMPEYTPLEPNALEHHPLMGDISDLPPIQTKLTIGAPGDRYEQEADTVARKVVSQINSPVAPGDTAGDTDLQTKPATKILQRHPEGRNITVSPFAGMVQGKEAIGGGEASSDLESSINTAKGGGQPLDAGLQESMGQAMGADFSGVKVHTDANSDQLNKSIQAKAFTTGQDIFFAQRRYDPGSKGGQELIAHELTHVVQQNGNLQMKMIQRDETPLYSKVIGTKDPEQLYGAEIGAKKIVEASSESLKQAYELLMKAGFFESIKTTQDSPGGLKSEISQEFYAGAQLKGTVSAEVKDVIAGIKLLAESSVQAGMGRSYAEKLSWNAGQYKRQLEAKLERFVGFKATAKGELKLNVLDGLVLTGSAEATAGATLTVSGAAQISKGNLGGKLEGEATGFAGAEAKASGSVNFGPGTVAASGTVEAFAGAKATGKVSGSFINRKGNKLFYISLSGTASTGVGAKATGHVGKEKGKVKVGAGLGGTVAIGGSGTVAIEIDILEIKNTLKVAYSSPSMDKLTGLVADKRPNIPDDQIAEMKQELHNAFYQSFYNYAYKKAQDVQSGKAKHYAKREQVQKIIAEQVQSNDKLVELIWCKESDDELAKIAYEATAKAANDAGVPDLKAKSQQSFQIRRGVIIFWPYKA